MKVMKNVKERAESLELLLVAVYSDFLANIAKRNIHDYLLPLGPITEHNPDSMLGRKKEGN